MRANFRHLAQGIVNRGSVSSASAKNDHCSTKPPLMGLLGTVTGMIRTFQAITLFGTGDPKTMAGGISEALVTTMLGLIVAIPLVLLHSWVSSLSRGVTDVLEEESAGLIAARAERGETGEAAA